MNHVFLSGNAGADPALTTVSTAAGDTKQVTFSIAVTDKCYGTENKKIPDRTDWFTVVFRGKNAEVIAEKVKKGSRVTVSGKIHVKDYEKDGVRKVFVEIEGENFEINHHL